MFRLTRPPHSIIFNLVVNKQKEITAIFAALADPTRRRIMVHLSERGETRVTALAKPHRISLPAISRHLRVLEDARLIRRRREGREHLIQARAAGLKEGQEWMARCAALWDSKFDTLEELLEREQRRKKKR